MKIHRFALVAALLSTFALANAEDKVAKQLEANYAALSAAFKRGDVKPIGNLMTSDFTAKDSSGKVSLDREQILAQYKQQFGTLKNIVWTRKIKSLAKSGKVVVATVDGKVTGDVTTGDNKSHKVDVTAELKDTWLNTGKGWLLQTTTIVKKVTLVDGKAQPTG